MIINWTKNCVKIIPVVGKDNQAIGGKVIRLLPGLNEVDVKEWNIAKVHLQYEKQFCIEVKEEITTEKETKDKAGKISKKEVIKNVTNFNEFSIKKARKAIADCFDIITLEKWSENEGRADIRNLILDKIKAIKDRKIDETIGKREQ